MLRLTKYLCKTNINAVQKNGSLGVPVFCRVKKQEAST